VGCFQILSYFVSHSALLLLLYVAVAVVTQLVREGHEYKDTDNFLSR
jgi:hypothetical protein